MPLRSRPCTASATGWDPVTDPVTRPETGDRSTPPRRRWRLRPTLLPRLRTIFLALNLFVLLLPIGGIGLLRLYESALVHQTEAELLSQAAVLEAVWRSSYRRAVADAGMAGTAEPGRGRGGDAVWSPSGAEDAQALAFERALRGSSGTPAVMFNEAPGRRLPDGAEPGQGKGTFAPLQPRLDMAVDPVEPPPRDPEPAFVPVDPFAVRVGLAVQPMLAEIQRQTLSGIQVLDHHGILVAATAGLPATGPGAARSLAHLDEVRRARDGRSSSVLRARADSSPDGLAGLSRRAAIRVFVAHPVVDGDRLVGVLLLSRTPKGVLKGLYEQRFAIGIAAAMILLVMVGLSLATSRLVARPVEALIRQSRMAAEGNPGGGTPISIPVSREIAELSGAMAAMAATLDRRARYIRDFATRVSHEFKTPLTAIEGAVELLREHGSDMADADRERFLGNMTRDTGRLTRLVGRLMEMARADVMTPAGGLASLSEILDAISRREAENGLDVRVDGAAGLRITMAREVLETVLGNLVENARQHGARTVGVSVESPAGGGDRRVDRVSGNRRSGLPDGRALLTVTVSDDGPGVPPDKAADIFTPFHTTRRDSGGTGLGLAIVRALVEAHGGSIILRPPDPDGLRRGASFRLELPRADGQDRD